MQELKLHIKGLFTHPSDLSAVPDGALSVADDIVIDQEDVGSPRRGFNRSAVSFTTTTDRAKKLYVYQNYLFAHLGASTLAYFNNSDTGAFSTDDTTAWTELAGTFAPITDTKVHFSESNQNLYFTTAAGVYKLDAFDSAATKAGGYKGLDCSAELQDVTGNWLTSDYRTAYRVVWGYKDANNNLILGAPSQREEITNSADATRAVKLTITIPSGVTTAWFYQVYRATAVDQSGGEAPPSDELALVYEANPTTVDITNEYVQFTDIVPDELRGATIYTAGTQEGLAMGNEQPPMAQDIAVYKGSTFYANVTSKNRLYVTLLGVGGTNGLAMNDAITVDSVSYTAKLVEDISSAEFKVNAFSFTDADVSTADDTITLTGHGLANGTTITLASSGTLPSGLAAAITYYVVNTDTDTFQLSESLGGSAIDITAASGGGTHRGAVGDSSASQNITEAALSLVRVINRYTSSKVYAYYLSGPDDLPGKLLLEERGIGAAAFSATSSKTTCWTPDFTSAQSSTNDRFKNGLFYSKNGQPEAVPLPNYFLCGSAQQSILRIMPLRDSLFILKDDGIYRLSGNDASSFVVELFDSTTHLLAPESAVVLNNQIYALTDQGVVAITEGGVSVKSRPIETTLLSLQGVNAAVLKSETFGVSYETDRKYLLFVPTLSGDAEPTQAFVYNTFTDSWTRWVLNKTAGVVNPHDNKLYLADATAAYVNQERKAFNHTDYADYRETITISAVSGKTLTVTNSDLMAAGDVIYQSDTVFSTVASVNTQAGTVTTDFAADFAVDDATLYSAIKSKIAWVPITAGNPASLKHFRECTLLFKSYFAGSGTLIFTSDVSPSQEMELVTGAAAGLWGLFGWGMAPWGGVNNRRPIRVLIPRNKQRASQLTVQFQHSTGYTKYQLNGLSIIANPSGTRVAV